MDQLECTKPKKKKRRKSRTVKSNFWFWKTDASTGLGIAGAVFLLSCGDNAVQRSVSDSNGVVCFSCICAGCYTLSELLTPPGYLPNTQTYQVCVDAGGCVYIDGTPAEQFTVPNVRPEPVRGSFAGLKYDEQTRQPLSGAMFELSEYELAIAREISDSSGEFTFENLAPGIYDLEEIRPPDGYQPTARKFTVVVSEEGIVTIDGIVSDLYYFSNLPVSYGIELYQSPGDLSVVQEVEADVLADGTVLV